MSRPRKQAPRRTDPAAEPTLQESDDDIDQDRTDQRPSKSARKREAHELQRLGDALVALHPDQLASMPLDDTLREAIDLAHRIKAREGLRRQRQLIGKLMRDVDADAIRAALAAGSAGHRAEVALARAAEDWRERLLADDTALAAFGRRFGTGNDESTLARLIGQARAERAGERAGGSYRSLYRTLLAAMREHASGGAASRATQDPQDTQERP